ncbi:MAG: Uma2 family endonuclease [Chitinophagaceae bacterium]|nr:Uma2 family endonuclease [Chitinophagaceae bacterium]
MENNMVQEAAPKYNYYSPAEYLELERASDEKHEYFDGQVYNMAGASMNHVQVSANVFISTGSFLKGKECSIYSSDLKVTNKQKDAYTYPDLLIVCGKKEFDDEMADVLLNPSVIIEILSLSTRSIDKGRKFFYYQEIKSLNEYFMIDTIKQRVFTARKQPDERWLTELPVETGSIFIETINFHLSLSDIYNGTGIE